MAASPEVARNTKRFYVTAWWRRLVVVVVCFGVQAAAFTDPGDGEPGFHIFFGT